MESLAIQGVLNGLEQVVIVKAVHRPIV